MTELDGAPAFMGVARDITERRRAEADRRRLEDQLQHAVKMESIGRLAGGVAHDFNNLLTVILGNVEIASHRLPRDRSVQDALGEVRAAAMSAAGLTRQLLAFSRRQIVEPRLVDLNALIARMHKMLVRLIGEDIELRTLPGPGLATVKIDPGLAEQVLVNLAVNARDAMPRGGVLVIETSAVMLDEECQRRPPAGGAGRVCPTGYQRHRLRHERRGEAPPVQSRSSPPSHAAKGPDWAWRTTYGAIRQSNGAHRSLFRGGQGHDLQDLPAGQVRGARVAHSAAQVAVGHRGQRDHLGGRGRRARAQHCGLRRCATPAITFWWPATARPRWR